MNAYQIAMRMEKEAEKAYRDMAEQTVDSTMKKLLLRLADDEVRHFSSFEKMANNESALKDIENFSDKFFAKDIFSEIKAQNKRYNFNQEQVDFYNKAARVEDETYNFYLEQAQIATDADTKKVFTLIANEEKKHHDIVNNLASFVSAPDVWLESAEFYKIVEEE
ncbi:MAG: ferritin family protein [Sulfurospirillum sp.]|nr:ferritin family protein [Sulfurospirillum sp.]